MRYENIEILKNRGKNKTVLLGDSVCVVIADGTIEKMTTFSAVKDNMVEELLEVGHWVRTNILKQPDDFVIYRELFTQCELGGAIESYCVGREVHVIAGIADMSSYSKAKIGSAIKNKPIDRKALAKMLVRTAFGLEKKKPEEIIRRCKGLGFWS